MPPSPLQRTFWPLTACLLGLALFDRLPWLLKAAKFVDADHAVWGLMARHIAQGLPWPIYMYGQGYMGAAEAYFLAPWFAWLGSSPQVMAWAMSGLFLLTLLLAALLARGLAGPGLALGALLLAALAPPFFIRVTLLCYGGYVSVGLWGILLWLLWSRVYVVAPHPQPGPGAWRLWLLALVAGLGWWTWAMFWLFVLPCLLGHAVALAPGLRPWPCARRLWAAQRAHLMGLGALVLGFAAKLVVDLAFYLGPMRAWGGYVQPVYPVGPGRVAANGALLWQSLLPGAWQLHAPLDQAWLGRALALAVIAAALGVAAAAWRGARQQGLWPWLRANWLAAACASSLLALVLALLATSAMVDRFSVRYLGVSILWWPFLLAWGVGALWARVRWAGVLAGAWLAGVLAAAAITVVLHPAAWAINFWQGHYGPLIRVMEEQGVQRGWADYAEAYKLSYLSGERYLFSPGTEFRDSQVRYPPHEARIRAAGRQIYLFRPKVDRAARDKVRARLKREGVPYQEQDLGRFWVIVTGKGP